MCMMSGWVVDWWWMDGCDVDGYVMDVGELMDVWWVDDGWIYI